MRMRWTVGFLGGGARTMVAPVCAGYAVVAEGDVQLTGDALVPLEQFGLGGLCRCGAIAKMRC